MLLPLIPFIISTLPNLILFSALAFALYYILVAVQKPKFVASPDAKFAQFLAANCPAIGEYYYPTFWALHTHLMTRVATALRARQSRLTYHRENLTTPDGGLVSLDWYDPTCTKTKLDDASFVPNPEDLDRPVAVFFPGITGTSQTDYFRSLLPIAHRAGFRAVAVNYRGVARNPLRTAMLYSATSVDDVSAVVDHICANHCDARTPLLAVGVSLGGVLLAGYLAREGARSRIDFAMLISVCWDMAAGVNRLERGWPNRQLNRMLTDCLVRVVIRNRHHFESDRRYDLSRLSCMRTLRQLDTDYTRKMLGYECVEDYYSAASHRNSIHKIAIPTLCLQAADDMIAVEADLPTRQQIEQSKYFAMIVTARGGHVGFMESIHSGRYYHERLFAQYLDALCRFSAADVARRLHT